MTPQIIALVFNIRQRELTPERSASPGASLIIMAAKYVSEAYRRMSAQLRQKAAREPIGDMRRDLEAQAEHFLLLAEAMEEITPTTRE